MLIFYLAAQAKVPFIEIAGNLLEASNRSVSRLRDHGGAHRTNNFKFPGTEVMLKAKAATEHDYIRMQSDKKIYYEQLEAHIGRPLTDEEKYGTRQQTTSTHHRAWQDLDPVIQQWVINNELPTYNHRSDKYKVICCHITLMNKYDNVTFAQSDIDNYLIENLLLGADADGE